MIVSDHPHKINELQIHVLWEVNALLELTSLYGHTKGAKKDKHANGNMAKTQSSMTSIILEMVLVSPQSGFKIK